MFIRLNKNTVLETYISKSFQLYKDKIIELHNEQFKQEDITGESKKQFKVLNYHIAILYVILIYNDIITKSNNLLNWEYYNTKYEIDKYRISFACKGVDIDKILNIFNLPYINSNGIENMGIESNFIIEPLGIIPLIPVSFDINKLLSETSDCINYIDNNSILDSHFILETVGNVEIHLSI